MTRGKGSHVYNSHYKGAINVDGVDYWLDGWIKDGANGKFISGSLKRKDAQQGGGAYQAPRQTFDTVPSDLDDDVPFATANPALEHRVG